jgi:hypothetical protein
VNWQKGQNMTKEHTEQTATATAEEQGNVGRICKVQTENGETLWTTSGIALYIGITEPQVRRWVRRGLLHPVKEHSRPFVFREAEVMHLLEDVEDE